MQKYKYQKTIDLFLKMVQVDSPSFSESNMVDFIINYITEKKWNCEIHRQPISIKDMESFDPDAYNKLTADEQAKSTEQLQVVFEASDDTKASVFFAAHIDTVEPGKGIKPIVVDDKITSDGTTVLGSDDKSGVAGMLIAVEEILSANIPHGKIVLLFDALEEIGLVGAKFVPINDFNVDYGFVFDTVDTVGRLVERVQHTQSFEINLEVSDMPNHAKSLLVPNALTISAEIITQIPKGLFNDEDYTFTQVSSLVTSNAPGYLVPNKATIKGSIRSFIPEELKVLRQQLECILDRLTYANTVISYKILPKNTMGYNHSQTEMGKLMIAKAEAVLKEMNKPALHITKGLGGHDASIFVAKGVPTMVLSCGMQDIHTTKEWIYLSDLNDVTELIIRLIKKA